MTTAVRPPRLPAQLFSTAGYFLPRLMFLNARYAPQAHWGDVTTSLRGFPTENLDLASAEFWEEWRERWVGTATQYELLAAESTTPAGRRTALRGAAAAYHWAEFMYFDDVDVKLDLRARVRDCFQASLSGTDLDLRADSVRVDGADVPFWVIRPPRPSGTTEPVPCVLISNGLDSMTEVEALSLGETYLERGIAVVLFDGPGQGLSIGRIPLRTDMEVVCRAIVERINGIAWIDRSRLGFVGISFGGYFALRVAQYLPELFSCVVNYSGGPALAPFDSLPRRLKSDFEFALGTVGAEATQHRFDALTLDLTVSPGARMLSVHGALDDIFPLAELERLDEAWGDRHELIVYSDEAHVCLNRVAQTTLRAADWVDRCLSNH